MLRSIIAFSLKNAGLVTLVSLLLLVVTAYSLTKIPVDVFPELNAPTVTIITESGGLSAEEVEQVISFPIETAVNGLPSLRRVRSSSSLGLSIVWAEFSWGTDIYKARQMISERLNSVEESLPENTHLQMAPISSITGEIMLVALSATAEDVSESDLRSYAEFNLRNRLLTVSGVSQVVAIGGRLPEYQVDYRQEDLLLYGLSSAQVAEALSKAHNLNTAGFLVNVQGLELPIRQSGRVEGLEDISSTIVTYQDGIAVTVGDVATVKVGGAMRRGAASDNGKEAVVISIQKAPGTNTLDLTKRVDALLLQVEQSLPEGMALNRKVFRQADFIKRSVDNVVGVLVEASIIVTLILMLFLMNWRTTLITLMALPVSLGVTLLVMWMAGMSINVMTLGGLAVAIGILVDDSIIDVENSYRRLVDNSLLPVDQQKGFLRSLFDSSNEIRSSIVFATIIICMVFIPLLFLDGLEGRFFQPLGFTYIISVMVSLMVAMTLTPALSALLMKRDVIASDHGEGRLSRWLKAAYSWPLSLCLRWRALTLGSSALLTVLTLWFASTFGSSFLPDFNEGTYTLFLMMPPGTSLEESERVALNVQRQLKEIEGIEHVVSRSGRAERDEHAEPPSNSEVEVHMIEGANASEVLKKIDEVFDHLPGVTTNVGQPISHRLSHVMSGTKAQIAINIYGESLPMLRQLAKEVETALKSMSSTRDVAANREVMVETLAVNFRRADLARFGLSSEEAGAQVKRALYGDVVSVIHDGVQRFDLVIRLDEEQRDSVEDVGEVVLVGMGGALVRLHEVADIGPEQASNLISRQNGQRKTVVSTNVAEGYNLGDTVVEIKKVVNPIVLGAGYGVEYAGQFEAQQSASKTIMMAGSAVLLLMLLMLSAALGGVRPALLVMLNLPLAMIGGIIAMFWAESANPIVNLLSLFGMGGRYIAPVISIASLVGLITLFGIAVRNGILLVNHFRWLMEHENMSLQDAVSKGSQERLIPVLMTALSAMLGLIPLAIKMGEPGSELLAPLAVVVLGGLISSTLLNMIVVPAGYVMFCGRGSKASEVKEDLSF